MRNKQLLAWALLLVIYCISIAHAVDQLDADVKDTDDKIATTDKNNNNIVYDIRFSAIPNEVEGLWGIRLDKNKSKSDHIEYVTNRKKNVGRYPELIRMIIDGDN